MFSRRIVFRTFRQSLRNSRKSLKLLHAVYTDVRNCSEVVEVQNLQFFQEKFSIFSRCFGKKTYEIKILCENAAQSVFKLTILHTREVRLGIIEVGKTPF